MLMLFGLLIKIAYVAAVITAWSYMLFHMLMLDKLFRINGPRHRRFDELDAQRSVIDKSKR